MHRRELCVAAMASGLLIFNLWSGTEALSAASIEGEATASSTAADSLPKGAVDGDRFSVHAGSLWKGESGQKTWWWQVRFAKPRPVGAILQVHGDRPLSFRNLPIWGACGGAQILAILEETGVDRPWDCPRCRDPKNPKLPVYTHIGHTGEAPCGDYSKNLGERGKYEVRIVAQDPAFEGLPKLFETMEAHVGQIAHVPKGWMRVVTKGPKGLTENQCIRVADRYIYAAQFHMELPGTPEPSRKIMSNFLAAAKRWGGYNPQGEPIAPPKPVDP